MSETRPFVKGKCKKIKIPSKNNSGPARMVLLENFGAGPFASNYGGPLAIMSHVNYHDGLANL
jgi:hypothetical protein